MNNTKMKLDEKEVRRAYTDYYKNGLSWRKIEQKYGIYRTTMMTYFSRGYITGVQDGLKGINRLEGDKDGKSAR